MSGIAGCRVAMGPAAIERAGLVRGEQGYSPTVQRPVAEAIRDHLPATMELALFAFMPILVVGMGLGLAAGWPWASWAGRSSSRTCSASMA